MASTRYALTPESAHFPSTSGTTKYYVLPAKARYDGTYWDGISVVTA